MTLSRRDHPGPQRHVFVVGVGPPGDPNDMCLSLGWDHQGATTRAGEGETGLEQGVELATKNPVSADKAESGTS